MFQISTMMNKVKEYQQDEMIEAIRNEQSLLLQNKSDMKLKIIMKKNMRIYRNEKKRCHC